MPNDEASEALIDRALGIEGGEGDEITPPPGETPEGGEQAPTGDTPPAGDGADGGEELDPKSKAFLAWAESDPEGAEAYLAHLDQQEAAKAKPASKADAAPVVDEAELVLQQKVDYQAHVADRVEDFQDYRNAFNAERDQYEVVREEYNVAFENMVNELMEDLGISKEIAERRVISNPMVVKERQRLRGWNQHLVNAKGEMDTKAGYLRRVSQIEKEVDAYPRFQPYRIVYAEMRLNGTIKGAEPVARRQELLNAELIKRGQKPIGARAGQTPDRKALLERFKKKTSINLGRQGGGVGGGRPRSEANPNPIGSTGNALADKALENI